MTCTTNQCWWLTVRCETPLLAAAPGVKAPDSGRNPALRHLRFLARSLPTLMTNGRRSRRHRPGLISSARETNRGGLQPRLQVLLLPLEGDALSGQPFPDGRRPPRDVHPSVARVAIRTGCHRRLAGWWARAHGPRLLRALGEVVEQYKKPGQQVSYTIQTNGTKIDDAWAAFFKQHKVLVGLSVDGPKALHDTYRVDKGGKGSFDDVMRGWRFLNKHGVEVNIMCAVHAANGDHPVEVYRFFRDELKTEFIQVHPDHRTRDAAVAAHRQQGMGRARPVFVRPTGPRTTPSTAK